MDNAKLGFSKHEYGLRDERVFSILSRKHFFNVIAPCLFLQIGYQPWQTPDHHRTPRSSHSIDDEEDE